MERASPSYDFQPLTERTAQSWIKYLSKSDKYPELNENANGLLQMLSNEDLQKIQSSIQSVRADISLFLWEQTNIIADSELSEIVADLHAYLAYLDSLEIIIRDIRSNGAN